MVQINRVLEPTRPFSTYLMFVVKTRNLPTVENLKSSTLGETPSSLTNIRQDWKGLSLTKIQTSYKYS
jgi:hypothetical protein